MNKHTSKIMSILLCLAIGFMMANCGGGSKPGQYEDNEKSEEITETTNEETSPENTEDQSASEHKSYNLDTEYYYDLIINISIPIVTKYSDIKEKFGERIKDETGDRDKEWIGVSISMNNVIIDGNKFSGLYEIGSPNLNEDNWKTWEGKKHHGTNKEIFKVKGEFSEDSRIIKYIELERLWFSHYGQLDASFGMQKHRHYAELADIPVRRGYEQDIYYKIFQYKYKPETTVYGSSYFLDDAKGLISSITNTDYIKYSAKKLLGKNRKGKILKDVWEEKDEALEGIRTEFLDNNPPRNWTITFRKGKKIEDKDKALEEIESKNEPIIGEEKGGSLIMVKYSFTPDEPIQIMAIYKFKNNPVYGDRFNDIYVGILPSEIPLDFFIGEGLEKKKYTVKNNELKIYKNDNQYVTKTAFQFLAPSPWENDKGEQQEISKSDIVLFAIDKNKVVEIDRKAIVVLLENQKYELRVFDEKETFLPNQKIRIIYNENNSDTMQITDLWIGMTEKNAKSTGFSPAKSDFIVTQDVKHNKNYNMYFTAPDKPGQYKFILIKDGLEVSDERGVLYFDVVEK